MPMDAYTYDSQDTENRLEIQTIITRYDSLRTRYVTEGCIACPHCEHWTYRGWCPRCGWVFIPIDTLQLPVITAEVRGYKNYGIGQCKTCGKDFQRNSPTHDYCDEHSVRKSREERKKRLVNSQHRVKVRQAGDHPWRGRG